VDGRVPIRAAGPAADENAVKAPATIMSGGSHADCHPHARGGRAPIRPSDSPAEDQSADVRDRGTAGDCMQACMSPTRAAAAASLSPSARPRRWRAPRAPDGGALRRGRRRANQLAEPAGHVGRRGRACHQDGTGRGRPRQVLRRRYGRQVRQQRLPAPRGRGRRHRRRRAVRGASAAATQAPPARLVESGEPPLGRLERRTLLRRRCSPRAFLDARQAQVTASRLASH
jgi:hypothetical protein